MSELSQETNFDWQELDHRITSSGLDLTIRHDVNEGRLELLAIDENGVTETVLSPSKVFDAFEHPTVTPGILPDAEESPWDKALDAYNDLSENEKLWAARQIEADISKGFFAPTLALDAVKRQARQRKPERQLEQAA